MGWLSTSTLVVVYNVVLWMLPVKKLGYQPSRIIGGLLIFPLYLVFRDLQSWPFIASFLVWETARIRELRKDEHWDWVDYSIALVFFGLIGYSYLYHYHSFTFSQLWQP